MRKLLFFSRVAFICNICFLITLVLLFVPAARNHNTSSTIIIMGRLLAVIISLPLVIAYIITGVNRRLFAHVPAWLVITNFLLFVAQVIFLVK